MSILLIGQKSSPPPLQYQITTPKHYEISRGYNMRQVRHRTQLQQQIEENRQRKIKQKQLERALDKQRQIAFLKQVSRREQQKEPKQWFGRRSFCNKQFHDYRNNFLENTNISLNTPNMKHRSSNMMLVQRKPVRKPIDITIRPIQYIPRTIKTQNTAYQHQNTQSQIFYKPVSGNNQVRENQNQRFRQVQEQYEEIDDESQDKIWKPIKRQKSSRLKRLNEKLNRHNFDKKIQEQNQFSELPSWSTNKPLRRFYQQENRQQAFQIKQGRKCQQYPKRSQLCNNRNNRLKGLHKRILYKSGQ